MSGYIKRFYTSTEVAKFLGVSPKTVSRLAKQNRIPSERSGWAYRYPVEEIDQMVAANERNREIARLFTQENMSTRQIAIKYGTSYSKIRYILHVSGVLPRDAAQQSARVTKIAEDIRKGIIAGTWKPGQKIPPQSDLMARYRTTTQVIGMVIAHLENRGYVKILRYRGTYVRPEQDWNTTDHPA